MTVKILESLMLPCLQKKYFGVECLGCGIQRAISLLLEGNFIEAFYMYPAIYTLLLLGLHLFLKPFIFFKYTYLITNVLLIVNGIIIFTNYILKFI